MNTPMATLAEIIRKYESEILADWVREQAAVPSRRNAVHEAEMRTLSRDFLNAVQEALNGNAGGDVRGAGWSRAYAASCCRFRCT